MSASTEPAPTAVRLLRRIDPWLVCAALLALIPLEILARPGVPHTADGQVHLLRTLEVASLLHQGVLYPRWAPDFYLGYGYPFFNFYAPGAHILGAWLALFGLGVVRAVTAVQIVALFLYPTGAYLAARSILPSGRGRGASGPVALLAAALYLYAPLRFRELFVQGNLSQWLAVALLPWCAWLLAGVAQRGRPGRAVAGGFLLAALLYAHHPTAFLGWPSLAVYAVAIAAITSPRDLRRRLLAIGGSFALGLALGAPFWLPSLVELRDANLTAIATGSFSVRLNLLSLGELLALPVIQDGAALNPYMPNSLGIAQAVLALPGLVVALWWALRGGRHARLREDANQAGSSRAGLEVCWSERQAGQTLLAVAALLAGSLFLMLPVAARAWDVLPLAQFIAFPWRLLAPALLWASLLGCAGLFLVPARLRVPALAVTLLVILLSVGPYLFPRPFGPAPEPALADITRYEIGGGALATASANEYLPRWVQDSRVPRQMADDFLAGRPAQRLDATSLPTGSRAEATIQRGLDDRYRLDLTAAGTIRLNRFFFPGWRAWVDGQPAQVAPGGPYGLIDVSVPAGHHDLLVAFGSTPARLAGDLLALLALGIVAVLGWRHHRRASAALAPQVAGPREQPYQPAMIIAGLLLAATAFKVGVAGPHTSWFRQQSPADRPAEMQYPTGTRFANGVELLGYSLSRRDVRQGDTLGVRLYWRALGPRPADARPFLHLDSLTGETTWANETKLNAGEKPMSSWTPGFFVIDDYKLEVPKGTPAVTGLLRAGLLRAGEELVPLASGADLATLGPIGVREQSPLIADAVPNHDHTYRLGSAVRLAGYEIHETADARALDVTLYWQALSAVPADYTVFLHIVDAQGQPLPGQDGPPVHGWYPSSAWAVGQIIPDRRLVTLPAGVSARDVRFTTGLYTPADGRRAVVTDEHGVRQPGDEIRLP
jgi:hypothetical protein